CVRRVPACRRGSRPGSARRGACTAGAAAGPLMFDARSGNASDTDAVRAKKDHNRGCKGATASHQMAFCCACFFLASVPTMKAFPLTHTRTRRGADMKTIDHESTVQ